MLSPPIIPKIIDTHAKNTTNAKIITRIHITDFFVCSIHFCLV